MVSPLILLLCCKFIRNSICVFSVLIRSIYISFSMWRTQNTHTHSILCGAGYSLMSIIYYWFSILIKLANKPHSIYNTIPYHTRSLLTLSKCIAFGRARARSRLHTADRFTMNMMASFHYGHFVCAVSNSSCAE